MANALQSNRSNILQAGSYQFHREDGETIYKLYTKDGLTLWEIKEIYFENVTIRQIAVAICQGKMDLES